MELSITLIIIIITAAVSFGGFSSEKIINELIFYPPAVNEGRQWYRFISCGLIHADIGHLLFNMYALYIFGIHVENGVLLHGIAINGYKTDQSFVGLKPCGLDLPVSYLLKNQTGFVDLGNKIVLTALELLR